MNEIESNNTFSTANQIQAGTSVSGDVTTSGDVDVYELNISGAGRTDFQFSSSAGTVSRYSYDYDVKFYKSNQFFAGDLVGQGESKLSGLYPYWSSIFTTGPEKYYVKVSKGSGALSYSGKQFNYDLMSDFKAASFDSVSTGHSGIDVKQSVDEGSYVWFTLNTSNIYPNTKIPWSISGVSAADVEGSVMSGQQYVVDSNQFGQGTHGGISR